VHLRGKTGHATRVKVTHCDNLAREREADRSGDIWKYREIWKFVRGKYGHVKIYRTRIWRSYLRSVCAHCAIFDSDEQRPVRSRNDARKIYSGHSSTWRVLLRLFTTYARRLREDTIFGKQDDSFKGVNTDALLVARLIFDLRASHIDSYRDPRFKIYRQTRSVSLLIKRDKLSEDQIPRTKRVAEVREDPKVSRF